MRLDNMTHAGWQTVSIESHVGRERCESSLWMAIYALVFIFFFADLLIYYGLVPSVVGFLPEVLIMYLFVAAVRWRRYTGVF